MSTFADREKMLIDKLSATDPLGQVAQVAKHLPQQEATKILRYATASGDAPDVVAANLNAYEKDNIGSVDWENALKEAPMTKTFLSNPLPLAIIQNKDNAEVLAGVENENKVWSAFKDGWKDAARTTLRSVQGIFESTATGAANDQKINAMPPEYQQWSQQGGADTLKKLGEATKELADAKTLQSKNVKADTTAGQYGLDVVRVIPQLITQIGTAMAAGPVGAAGLMGAQIAGGDYEKSRKDGVEPGRAMGAAIGDAALQAPLEAVGLGKIMKTVQKGVPVKDRIKRYFEAGLTEGVTEWLQQYPQGAADIYARGANMTPQEMTQKFIEDLGQNTREGLYQGAVAFPLGVFGGAVHNAMQRQATAAYVDNIEAVQTKLAGSAILAQSPELVEQHMEAITGGEKTYIDPDALVLYQMENPKAFEELGLTEQEVNAALQTGEMVEVSKARYVTAVSVDPALHDALKDDIAPTTDGLTPNRVTERKNTKDVQRTTDKIVEEENQLKSWRQEYSQGLKEAGIDNDVAKQILVGLTAHSKVMSDNPVEWLRQNAPEFKRGMGMQVGALAQFGGPSAKTADHLGLSQAQQMEKDGANKEAIRKATGWHKGMEGKWRFEIDDSQAELIDIAAVSKRIVTLYKQAHKAKDPAKKEELLAQVEAEEDEVTKPRLKNILNHPTLYKAYPWIADVKVVRSKLPKSENGGYDPATNTIQLSKDLSPEKMKETLLHEVQHVIQEQENFARGGSPVANSVEAFNEYLSLAGEIEARDTSSRANLTENQRKEVAPDLRSDAIIVHGGRAYSYQSNVENTEVSNFIKKAVNERGKTEEMMLRAVVDEEATLILERTGINVKGYRHVLQSNNLRHILLEHGIGKEQNENQVPLTETDLALIPDILNSPEVIEKGTPTKQGVPSIRYEKTDSSGTTTVVEVVSDSKKKLIVKTMWRKSPDIDHASDTDRVYTSETGAGKTSSTINNSIPNPKELFQSEKNPNGSIHWENGKAIITMMQTSNPSTVIHEMVGHYFFQNLVERAKMDDAPSHVKADVKTLLEWAGVEGSFDALTKEQKTEIHEKVARAAEVYVMTGKAPSIATQSLFRRFAEWMKQVYKSIRELGVEITPEVADVFDRMLATDAEISELEAVERYRQELPTEFLNQLTDGQRARLDMQLANVRAEAEERLRERIMLFINADNKAQMEEERKTATETITAQVNDEPFYKTAALIAETFKRPAKAVAQTFKSGKMRQDHEAEFEYLAELNGYSSGDELATHLIERNNVADEIAARIKVHMQAAFPDVMTSKEALQEEARKAMYNDGGSILLAMEQQIIEEKAGRFMKADEARDRAAALREAARITAKSMMAKRTIAEASNLQSYIAAERRAAADVAKFLQKKDYTSAIAAKERQQINHALIQECLRIRRETERIKKYLNRQRKAKNWLSDSTDEQGLRIKTNEYKDQAMSILARFGYARKDYVQPEEPLAEWMRRQEADEVNKAIINIAPWLAYDNTRQDIRKLTLEELQDVENAIKNIKTMARIGVNSDGFAFINSDGKEATIESLVAKSSQLTDKQIEQIEREKPTSLQEMRAGIKQGHRLFEMLDGFDSFGPWHETFYSSIKRAADFRSRLLGKVYTSLDDAFVSEGISKSERHRMAHKKIYIEEWNQSVTKNTLLAIALNMGNQSNLDRLTATRLVGLDTRAQWDIDSIKSVLEKYLTASEIRLVGKVWKAIEVYSEYNEMVKRMTGNELPKVEPLPITFNVGGEEIHLDGGYYPLSPDSRGSKQAELNAEKKLGDTPGMMPYPSTGRSKARAKSAQYAVDVDFANLYSNMTDIVQDIAFRPVAHDINKLMRDERVVKTIRGKLGEAEYQAILEWQKRTTSGRAETVKHTLDKFFNWARGATVISSLLLRPGVAVQNLANFGLYGNSVEEWANRDAMQAYMRHGWADYIPNALHNSARAKELRQFVYARSAQMRDKMENPDYSFREISGIGSHDNDLMKVQNGLVQEVGYKYAIGQENVIKFASDVFAWTDQLTDIPMWIGAYGKAKESGKTESQAVAFADAIIRNSTGTGRNIDTSRLQASGSAAERLFTMFQTFLNTAYNRWAAEYNIALHKKDAARLVKFMAVQYIMFGTMSALLSFKGPDDDEDWGKWFVKEVLEWPLGMIPLFGGVAKVALDKAMGFQTYAYKASPVFGKAEDALKLANIAQKVAEGEKELGDMAEPTANVASFFMKYPDQLNDWFFNAYDVLSGNMSPKLRDLVKRRPAKERK